MAMAEESIDLLVLSPHLDDAALSLGGHIVDRVQRGDRVVVLTLMTADPPQELSAAAQDLHQRWGLGEDVLATRRAEDRAACEVLGAVCVHWPLTDALYRKGRAGSPLYPSLSSLFGSLHPADGRRAHELARHFQQLPVARRVCAPLGIGGHVDHRLAREAAEIAFPDLEYFEDFPYARGRLARFKVLGPWWRWRFRTVALDEERLETKCRSIACYGSQLRTIFRDLDHMRDEVRRFHAARGGERLWSRRRS